MNSQILYLTLCDSARSRAEGELWIKRFIEFAAQPPFQLSIEAAKLDGDLASRVETAFREPKIETVAERLSEILAESNEQRVERPILPKLVVLCDADHALAKKSVANNAHAHWGGTIGILAVVYHHDAAVVWHEMFHLFGAKDCYDTDSPDELAVPKCGQSKCIMQYAATLEDVGDPPFICEDNVSRIRERIADLQQKTDLARTLKRDSG